MTWKGTGLTPLPPPIKQSRRYVNVRVVNRWTWSRPSLRVLPPTATTSLAIRASMLAGVSDANMLPSIQEIKARRKKLSLTQATLAKEAGVSQSLIAKIEAGTLDASYSNTVKIFNALERLEHKIIPTAGQVMHSGVQHVKTNDSVGKALKLMKSHDFSQLPVYDEDHPVGSLSDKTVLDKITQGTNIAELSEMKISDVMGDSFPVVDEKTPLPAISSLLNYHFAVLVRKKDQIAGIITKADLMKLVGK